MSHRIERFSSTLMHSLAEILLNDVNNPYLKSAAITEVVISPDRKKARVFVKAAAAVAESESEDPGELLRHLERAKGFIKKTLARRMYMKYVPELFFIIDDRSESAEPVTDSNGWEA